MSKIIILFSFFILLFFVEFGRAESNLAERLSGHILLEVEARGEAWYVNPSDLKRYYLGRPDDAFEIMQKLGVGITDKNLLKIPVGIAEDSEQDIDGDGLDDALENALGTDMAKNDTDGDGYNDKIEIENNYSPVSNGRPGIDENFTAANAGKIFLQVEGAGEAWYVEPAVQKRYYLGRPAAAFEIMKKFGLGIINENINQISIGSLSNSSLSNTQENKQTNGNNNPNNGDVISDAAGAIRSGDAEKAASCFTPEMKKAIEYTMDFLDKDGRLTLGNILSGSKLKSSSTNEKMYTNDVYFSLGGYDVTVKFYVKKQSDGSWLLANL